MAIVAIPQLLCPLSQDPIEKSDQARGLSSPGLLGIALSFSTGGPLVRRPGVAGSAVPIDPGLMWIGGALQARTGGPSGTEYLPKPEAVQPVNPNTIYRNSAAAVSEIAAESVLESVWD